MYFAVVTFTTTGYGDIPSTAGGGKMFRVLFALSGLAVLAIAHGVVGSKIVEAEVVSIAAAESEIVKHVAESFRRARTKLEKQIVPTVPGPSHTICSHLLINSNAFIHLASK